MSTKLAAPFERSLRAQLILDSAVVVLGREGSAGLTHRAVDREAGLPQGSTSNPYRTRESLISAIATHLIERDLAHIQKLIKGIRGEDAASGSDVALLVMSLINYWTEVDPLGTRARFEIYLIALRNPDLSLQLTDARDRVRLFVKKWLVSNWPGRDTHVDGLLAFVEGLAVIQALHPNRKLTHSELLSEISTYLTVLSVAKEDPLN